MLDVELFRKKVRWMFEGKTEGGRTIINKMYVTLHRRPQVESVFDILSGEPVVMITNDAGNANEVNLLIDIARRVAVGRLYLYDGYGNMMEDWLGQGMKMEHFEVDGRISLAAETEYFGIPVYLYYRVQTLSRIF